MLIRRIRGWEILQSEATPESVALDRRSLIAGAGALAMLGARPALAQGKDPTADLYPAARNDRYALDRPVTAEKLTANYNNFTEFSSSKYTAPAATALRTRPWTVKIDGLVEKPGEMDIDGLIRAMPIEERLYRHRCVETWSMAVPWTGFPLKALLDRVQPLSGAKYLRFETFLDPKVAPGQKRSWYPWPYVEGMTMAEAANELAFMAVGIYGKPLPNQFGAPLRLALPWKYGFKSIKSITRVSFVAERPKSFWETLQGDEYGFWANVNPAVPHRRWSQAEEEVLGTGERRPTLLFNGYGEHVAHLYKGLEKEPLWI